MFVGHTQTVRIPLSHVGSGDELHINFANNEQLKLYAYTTDKERKRVNVVHILRCGDFIGLIPGYEQMSDEGDQTPSNIEVPS